MQASLLAKVDAVGVGGPMICAHRHRHPPQWSSDDSFTFSPSLFHTIVSHLLPCFFTNLTSDMASCCRRVTCSHDDNSNDNDNDDDVLVLVPVLVPVLGAFTHAFDMSDSESVS